MTNRGFLIRFIDIGLIMLFGFVMISDIETISQVDLSAAAVVDADTPPPTARRSVAVAIAPSGAFAVVDPADAGVLAGEVTGTAGLQRVLAALRDRSSAEGQHLFVLIEPHEASIVQWTVDVMDVCDRLGVARSLQTALGAGPIS